MNITSIHMDGRKVTYNEFAGTVFGIKETQSILTLLALYHGRGKRLNAYSNYDLSNQEVTCYDPYYDIPDSVHSVHFQFMEYVSRKVVCKIYYPNVDIFEIVAPSMQVAVEVVATLKKYYLAQKAKQNIKEELLDVPSLYPYPIVDNDEVASEISPSTVTPEQIREYMELRKSNA